MSGHCLMEPSGFCVDVVFKNFYIVMPKDGSWN